MSAVVDVLAKPAFLTALAISAAGALVVLAVARGGNTARQYPIGGLLIVAATGAGLRRADAFAGGTSWLVVGSVSLALAPLACRRVHPAATAILLLAGATCVATAAAAVDDRTWVSALVVGATAVGAVGAARVDREGARFGLGPILFAATAAGVFVCVPDTEQAIPLLAASAGILVALWPPVCIRLGASGAFGAVGLVLWTAAVGGTGRPGSVVGAVGCLGMLVVAPAVDALVSTDAPRHGGSTSRGPRPEAVRVVVLHVLVVLFCARVAGFQSAALPAAALVLMAFVVSGVALGAAGRER